VCCVLYCIVLYCIVFHCNIRRKNPHHCNYFKNTSCFYVSHLYLLTCISHTINHGTLCWTIWIILGLGISKNIRGSRWIQKEVWRTFRQETIFIDCCMGSWNFVVYCKFRLQFGKSSRGLPFANKKKSTTVMIIMNVKINCCLKSTYYFNVSEYWSTEKKGVFNV
jgi:hypothetical protein